MTIEEANIFLDNLKVCINEHPVVADWLVEIANRKTEPSDSGKPNNCETCGTPKHLCQYCIEEDRMWTPKTEPQSNILLDAMAKAFGIEYEPKTEPQILKGGEDVHEFCKRCGESKARTIGEERYIVCEKASDMVCVSIKECPLGKWVCEDIYIIVP